MSLKVNSIQTVQSANNETRNKKEYKDPLLTWPLRGVAFTNEVGEALRPLIGSYATLTWVPALLYIGADVYDKYKNDQTEYSPDSRRCLKQAVFQGMASIFLPLVAVKSGQSIFSLFGLASKDKLTISAKEHVIELAEQFVSNGKMRKYESDSAKALEEFLYTVHDNLDYSIQKEKKSNFIKKTLLQIDEFLHKKFEINSKKSIDSYATTTLNEITELRKNILNPTEEFKKTKYHNIYQTGIQEGQTQSVSIKYTLIQKLQELKMNGKLIKTIGGFIALGALIRPIDHFVDTILIGKVVGPSIDKTKPTK